MMGNGLNGGKFINKKRELQYILFVSVQIVY